MAEEIPKAIAPMVEAKGAGVHRAHSHATIIQDINWTVQAGEFWVIGGRHGSGKSSFLATMSGLRPPASGLVKHFGLDVNELSETDALQQRRRIGFVFKGGGRMLPELTVAQNIALPLRYQHDWTEDEAEEFVGKLLAETELESIADLNAHTMTMGWQQRVGLARALVLQPEILFLDEPMVGLEFSHRMWWRKYLVKLLEGGGFMEGRKVTLVAATSDFTLWADAPHHFAEIQNGEFKNLGRLETAPPMN